MLAAGVPPTPALGGGWSLTPVEPAGAAIELMTRWMSEPHVEPFWRQAWPLDEWSMEIAHQLDGEHSRPWIVNHGGEPLAYVEVYRVARDVIAMHWDVGPHDLGIHIAIGDRARTGHGLGRRALRLVGEALLRADPSCGHVYGDPAVDHDRAIRCFQTAGFERIGDVDLPHKRAALLALSRDRVEGAMR